MSPDIFGGAWALLHEFLGLLCRNSPDRALSVFDAHSWACARCSGLYVGVPVAYLAAMAIGRRRLSAWSVLTTLGVAALMNGAQIVLESMQIAPPHAVSRLVLGALMGGGVGLILATRASRFSLAAAVACLALLSGLFGLMWQSGLALNISSSLGALTTLLALVAGFQTTWRKPA